MSPEQREESRLGMARPGDKGENSRGSRRLSTAGHLGIGDPRREEGGSCGGFENPQVPKRKD